MNQHADQTGNLPRILITGANTGIGLATARMLAQQGAHLVLACRNRQKADAAKREIEQTAHADSTVELVDLDLDDLQSVEHAAKDISQRYPSLDVLINNAGIFAPTLVKTKQGFESQFGVNYIGHFLLTHRLLPLLRNSPQARIINLASIAHLLGKMKPATYEGKSGLFNPLFHYGQSKLANLLFSHEMARRLQGSGITVNALHPGGVASDIYRKIPTPARQILLKTLVPTTVPAKLITNMALSSEWASRNGEYVSAHMPDWQSATAKNPSQAHELYQQTLDLLAQKGFSVEAANADATTIAQVD